MSIKSYPSELPCPILSYTLEYGEVFKRTDFSYGVRYRATQNIILPKNTLSFTLKLNPSEYVIFRQFLKDINNGLEWFYADWDYDGMGSEIKEFHFEAYPKFSRKDAYWDVTFTVTVKE
jgi:hypothetical protein